MQEISWKKLRSQPLLFNGLALLILLTLLAYRCWLTNQFPLHIDEVYTFVTFTFNGFWESLSQYPAPNNHVFFSLITAGFYKVLHHAFWSLRLPALLISLAVTVYAYIRVRRIASFGVALLGVGLFAFSHLSLVYSFSARGYFLETGFALLAAFSTLDFIRTGRRKFLIFLIFALAFGFLTVPVFLYPCLSVFLFGAITLSVQNRKKHLAAFVVAFCLAGLLTVLLYTPILLESGLESLIGNEYVVAARFSAIRDLFFSWLADVENTLVGREPYGWIVALGVLLTLVFLLINGIRKQGKSAFRSPAFQLDSLVLCMMLSPLVCILFQRVLPPTRVFLYLSVFQFVALAGLLEKGLQKLQFSKFFPALAIAMLALFGLHQARVLETQLVVVRKFSSYTGFLDLMEKEKPRLVYIADTYYMLTLKYAFLSKNLPHIQVNFQNYDPKVPYEYVLFPLNQPLPANFDRSRYREIYRDVSAVAFKRF